MAPRVQARNPQSPIDALALLAERADLRVETLALLRAQQSPIPPPVRAELFGVERLRQHGHSLARAQAVERRGWRRRARGTPFFPRIAANLHGIERARSYLEATDPDSEAMRPAAEWLLDNFHLIEAQVPEIRNGLPRGYYASLPKLRDPPLTGLPRIYGIAWAYVAHTDSNFDPALLTHLLAAYQQVDLLTLGELWALPSTLRVVLLENLARLAESAACHQAALELADACCDADPAPGAGWIDDVLRWLEARTLDTVFLAQMVTRARVQSNGTPAPWSAWLTARVPDPDATLAAAHGLLAADNVSVRNAVMALQAINNLPWRSLVEQNSPAVQTLLRSPAFALDSELTQDQCTHAVERFARRLRRPELEVARRAVELAAAADGDAQAGPAHGLIGDGRAALVSSLGGSPAALDQPLLRWLRRARGVLYGGALVGGTALLLAAVSAELGWQHLLDVAALALATLAAFECAVSVVNRSLAELVRVHRLPRIALDAGLQPEHRSLVVVPCLLGSAGEVRALARQLEQHYLANPENHARFALLSDWPDAAQRRVADDAALLDAARGAIDALNRAHPVAAGADTRFALLHRERSWNASEGAWLGWERKRGKLEQLITALAADGGPVNAPFVDLGPISALGQGVRYVVTLDSDTGLPPGALRQLVAIAAHPLNRPRIDPATKRVVSGYGILQPGLTAPLPHDDEVTLFGLLFSGPWGFDAYSSGSSEVFQDVFGHGRFSGKGLLDVHAIDASLRGRIPENSLLSHDLYEGIWARAAHLSDVRLVESAPMHPDVANSRLHRWTRGDWQLLPLLGASLRGRVGTLNLWKIIDNLRRSLLAPASLVFLWLCFATSALSPWVALALTGAAYGLGPLLGALAALVPPRRDIALRHFLREGLADVGRALGGTLWHLATLPLSALRETDAIARALWRMGVSRRHLLEWTTAAQAQAKAGLAWGGFWRRHFKVTALSAAWVVSGAALPAASLPWLLGMGTLWALTPLWLWAASQPLGPRRRPAVLDAAARGELQQLARDTWSLFERLVTAAEHHLPPDNLQLDPEPTVAHRTSPTNVGLYLASCVCAQRLGFIDLAQMTERLQATVATLGRLPRWHGHFDNWIDTGSLQPLSPRYVSTVDSGNLAACLWAVAQACRECAAQAEADPRLHAIAEQLDRFVAEMDFGPLYDRRRRLFRIGYRYDDGRLDPAFYDLLASESRLGSFVAIAKGDVPLEHWTALGRPFLGVDGEPVLRSWSGSMFEYLMPMLLMREPARSLLQRVSVAAVRTQRAFGQRHGVPWGVSECAYFEQDHTLAFQYGPFGVPQLALRRTPVDDLVIAPYASALALLVDAPAALANLRLLERLGARDRYGFIEALDYSAHRHEPGMPAQRVTAFMAHHQGMSLLSLCNLLCEDNPRRWFAHAPVAHAHRVLLHERMPRAIVFQSRAIPRSTRPTSGVASAASARLLDPRSAAPCAQPSALIGNGRYTVCLRPNGAGQSRWRGHAISRARDDLLRDAHGHWLMLRQAGAPAFHSLTAFPCPEPRTAYHTRFFGDHVEFEAIGRGLTSTVTVWVSSDDDVELRRVELHNLGDDSVELELASLFEAVLAPQPADESHPAFSKLFVSARAVDDGCILFERRPRRAGEKRIWVAHFLAAGDVKPEQLSLRCDRAQLMARGDPRPAPGTMRSVARPPGDGLETGLDPVASITARLRIPARSRHSMTFGTAAADDPGILMSIVDEYRQEVHVTRSSLMSATLARIRHRELQVSAAVLHFVQDLTTRMLMTPLTPRTAPEALDRRALWRLGVSGDRPILLMRINAEQGYRAVRALLTAQRLWQFGGLACDLLIVNGEPPSYQMPLQRRLREALGQAGVEIDTDSARGRTQVLRAADIAPGEWTALRAFARADCVADGRALDQLLAPLPDTETDGSAGAAAADPAPRPPLDGPRDSGFADGGRAFDIHIDADHVTPKPWANVLANPQFGCIVTESGGGHTWALNSRMNQLTTWSNDPLLDPPAEHFLVRDAVTGATFGLLPTLDRNEQRGYRISHRAGMSDFVHERPGLALDTRVMVHPQEPVKCLRLRLHNLESRPRRLQLLALVEWVMGAQRRDRMTLQTEFVADVQAVLARQLDRGGGFGDGTAFLMLAGHELGEWTCARQEFFDRQGRLRWPRALAGTQGFGLDPCGAVSADLTLAAGARFEAFWIIGYGDTRADAIALAERMAAPGAAAACSGAVEAHWDKLLSAVTVTTPDPLFDALVNRWLLYQTLACRLWAKAGYYQVSGATGFRDQLQDTLALVTARPDLLRQQLLRHAARQFEAGDVQHWWHEPSGAGVRTHSSDDLLWLPFAITHYLEATGDQGLLDASAPYLEGSQLPPQAEDVYEVPSLSTRVDPLYEHGARAIDHALRMGAHGLPLMGGGDWNDGMNAVGREGRGESVWLGWFLQIILRDWIPLAARRGDAERHAGWRAAHDGLARALAEHGWDGAWYRRAYFDNGHPLGSQANDECRIDLIAQAWSVFGSPPGDVRARTAMRSADEMLVDRRHRLVRLLHPPLQHAVDDAGYIQAYPPGVRENGGQYSHAAAWAVMAQAQLGHADLAWEYFCMISPAHRARSMDEQQQYGVEPYVLAGDTYTAAPYAGRGGWSWYTGSSAWLHRAAVESLLGLALRHDRLCLRPALPPHWPWARLALRLPDRELDVLLWRGSPDLAAGAGADALDVEPGQWIELAALPSPARLRLRLPGPPADAPVDRAQPSGRATA